jgi:hypothetical protein
LEETKLTVKKGNWYNNLQVGDEVAIDNGHLHIGPRYRIGTVTKITPTGQIQIDNKEPKFKHGYIKGDKYTATMCIHELTDVLKEKIFKEQMIDKLENMNFKNLTIKQLKEIQNILEKKDE